MGTSSDHRREDRKAVAMKAQCRTQSGLRDAGSISDISSDGCCVTTNGLFVTVGARVMIKPDGMEGLSGVIRWVDGLRAGIKFDTHIYEPVVEHLAAKHGAGQPVGVSAI